MVNDDIFTRRHQKTRIGAAEIKCFSSPTLRERKKKVKMFRHNGLTWGHWGLTLGTFSCHAVQCAVGWRRRGSTQDLKTNKVGVSRVQKSSNWPRYNTLKLLNLSKFSNNFSGKWLGNLEEKVCFLRQITSGKLSDYVHVLQPLRKNPLPPGRSILVWLWLAGDTDHYTIEETIEWGNKILRGINSLCRTK